MIRIHPFPAEIPPAEHAARVASVPYDVVSTQEARELAEGNEASFLHVVRPEIDLAEGVDPYCDAVYGRAASNLEAFRQQGLLNADEAPGIYLYKLTWRGRAQIGVVCCCEVGQYREGLIKRHEFTRPDKENDRVRHLVETGTHAEGVILTFHDATSIDELMAEDMTSPPLFEFTADDGVEHALWRASDPEAYVSAFASLGALYIADGHHRSAAAERAPRTELRTTGDGSMSLETLEQDLDHDGNEEFNRFMAVCFPASQLEILPYNRVVQDRAGLTTEAFLERLAEVGTVEPVTDPVPEERGEVRVHVDGSWYRLRFDPNRIDRSDPVGSLDCALLQDLVLDPILGIADPRTDQRIAFVGGIRGTEEIERRAGAEGIGFSMHPTSMGELLDVADAGLIMPPKSTWFEPKLRSGLFVHRFTGSRSCAS
ncbi:MAG: DUF1015 family protein [Phycisphaerales bacterium]|nr:DUF1015 family protein [Phycisphaerales bacterium]